MWVLGNGPTPRGGEVMRAILLERSSEVDRMDYEAAVPIEIHQRFDTAEKPFCRCPTLFGMSMSGQESSRYQGDGSEWRIDRAAEEEMSPSEVHLLHL